jgi:hypothetical protein
MRAGKRYEGGGRFLNRRASGEPKAGALRHRPSRNGHPYEGVGACALVPPPPTPTPRLHRRALEEHPGRAPIPCAPVRFFAHSFTATTRSGKWSG